jgi:hypothetical protein
LDQDVSTLVARGLQIVNHFNGVPVVCAKDASAEEGHLAMKPHMARFTISELLGESEYSARYDNSRLDEDDAQDESCWVLATTSSQTIARITSRTGTNTSFAPTRDVTSSQSFSPTIFFIVSLWAP